MEAKQTKRGNVNCRFKESGEGRKTTEGNEFFFLPSSKEQSAFLT